MARNLIEKPENMEEALKLLGELLEKQSGTDKPLDLTLSAKTSDATPKTSFNNQFIILFYKNLKNIIKNKGLTKNEMLVLLTLAEFMAHGNAINVTRKAIMHETGLESGNLSRVFGSLTKKQLLVTDAHGQLFMNPNVIAKGLTHKMREPERSKFKEIARTDENISSSFF